MAQVASSALIEWRGPRSQRIAALDGVRAGLPVASMQQERIDHSLTLLVAAEFQGYCRGLYDRTLDGVIGSLGIPYQSVEVNLRRGLRPNSLLGGNADSSRIAADFAQLGALSLWTLVANEDPNSTVYRQNLGVFLKVRNAVAHGNYGEILALLPTATTLYDYVMRRILPDLDQLAGALDATMAIFLASLLNLPNRPW